MPALALIALLAFHGQTLAPIDHGAPVDYGKRWDAIADAIANRFYARKARQEEIDARLKKYAPLAKAATTEAEFKDVVDRMIAEFGDSHFAYYDEDDQGYYVMDGLVRREAAGMPNLGVWLRPSPDGYTVSMVLEGTDGARAGLRKGDVILTVNGQPFTPVASLADKVGQTVRLALRRDGREVDADVKVDKTPALDWFLQATRDSARVIERNGKRYGYIHLWTQANDAFRNALSGAVYGKLYKTDGFILDLRDGFGGRPEGFADPFFRPEAELDWDTAGNTLHEQFGYQRPLVTIINGGSRSAKEVLAFILKKSRRAVLVGSPTAGNVLGTFPQRLDAHSYLELPMTDLVVDGQRLEKNPVTPNVPVAKEFDGDRDLFLETALDRLGRRRR